MSDTLQPHWLQHTWLPCPSFSPGVCSNSCPLSQWCHPTVSSSVGPFFSCLQSFPASESIPMSWLFTSGGQSIGASVSASILPMNMQGWLPLVLTGLISLQSKGLSRVFSSTTVRKHQFFSVASGHYFFPDFMCLFLYQYHAFYCCGIVCIKKNTLKFFFYFLRNF